MNYLLEGQESERLLYRKLMSQDYSTWLEFCKHPTATQYLLMYQHPSAKEKCDVWFERMRLRYEKGNGMNVLIDKHTGEFIGQCGLLIQTVEDKEELEIGYSILPEYWNKGYATEAATKCKHFAFENNLRNSLISIIHPKNIGSQKVALNNGMKLEKKTLFRKNNSVFVYRINKAEYSNGN